MSGFATACMYCGESTAYDDSKPYAVVVCKDCGSTACGDCHVNGYCLQCRECPPQDEHTHDKCSAIHPNETHEEWWTYQCDLPVDATSKVVDLSFG